jgi:hypothetical protein
MYIVWSNNIFAHSLTLVQLARRIGQPSLVRLAGLEWHRGQLRKDDDSLNATSRLRALRNITKQKRVFLSEARA